MAKTVALNGYQVSPPAFAVKGAHNSLLLIMTELGPKPHSGQLLKGLTPYLDEQGAAHVFLYTERQRREPWETSGEGAVKYQELVHLDRSPTGTIYKGVSAKGEVLNQNEVIQAFEYEPLGLIDWAARRTEGAVIRGNHPLQLRQLTIPKPWGNERWFTGIEKRGVCEVHTAFGSTPLPYALGMFPAALLGDVNATPILLKTLEPLPEPVYGDMYLEVHREKWEVYVVLEVNRKAWPNGAGNLRAGLAPKVIDKYKTDHGLGWEDALATELRNRINAYEKVRREIDAKLDTSLAKADKNPNEPVPLEEREKLLKGISAKLKEEEASKREAVEALLGTTPIKEGDIVTLPPGVLHSLQHGVKVIEFQTPTYERMIAMFGQKVLTQPHWDTDEAVAIMLKEPYNPPSILSLPAAEGVLLERVVDFPQFHVDRVTVELNRMYSQDIESDRQYRLLFVTHGKGELLTPDGGIYTLEAGVSLLLPACMGKYVINAIAAQGVTCLQASPTPPKSAHSKEEKTVNDNILNKVW